MEIFQAVKTLNSILQAHLELERADFVPNFA